MNQQKTIYTNNGKPFIVIGGEVHNSNSSSAEYMVKVWEKAEKLGMNTLLLPVSWEMVEPEEGTFCFDIVEKLILQARERDMKIIFLWFGSWKNAQCMYAPGWVKTDLNRFKRAQVVRGQNKVTLTDFHGIQYTTLSYLCEETCKADANAFAHLMKFLREIDGTEHTVLGVQVENETGLQGAAREHSDEADALFTQKVPQDFVDYMRSHTGTMEKDLRASIEKGATEGTWSEVFTDDADEVFSAYHVASYIGKVAQAGKAVYDLPLSVNCWLDQGTKPGIYPSGGPIAKMMELYHFCAPAIDVLAPDIYVRNFHDVCDQYSRPGNPLVIPETATHSYCAPRLVYTVGHHHASCFSPFGFEEMGDPFDSMMGVFFGMDVTDPLLNTPQNVDEYRRCALELRGMMPLLTEKYGSSNLQAVISEKMRQKCSPEAMEETLLFGDFGFKIEMNPPMVNRKDGVCLILKQGEEYYVLANGCMVTPFSADPEKPHCDILLAEEGSFASGEWKMERRLNGDETTMLTCNEYRVLRLRFFTYA